jgi:hypothetical protein
MGLLRHVPGMTGPIGSDHFVAVLEADDTLVRFHDPYGCPYATLPTQDFLAAWRADTITFYHAEPYTMRGDFQQIREITTEAALHAALPGAVAWLRGRDDLAVPPGTIGGAAAVHRLADLVTDGLDPETHDHLTHFAIRVRARRLTDAATALISLGRDEAAIIATQQARLGRQPSARLRQRTHGIRRPDVATTRSDLRPTGRRAQLTSPHPERPADGNLQPRQSGLTPATPARRHQTTEIVRIRTATGEKAV